MVSSGHLRNVSDVFIKVSSIFFYLTCKYDVSLKKEDKEGMTLPFSDKLLYPNAPSAGRHPTES